MKEYLGSRYEWSPGLGGWTNKHYLELYASGELSKFVNRGVSIRTYSHGWFPKQHIADTIAHGTKARPIWTSRGLYDYSWFMTLPEFLAAADALNDRDLAIGIMCCEALYFKCHRSMVSDYLVWRGFEVLHLSPKYRQVNKVKFVVGRRATSHRAVLGNRIARYHPDILKCWEDWRENHLGARNGESTIAN